MIPRWPSISQNIKLGGVSRKSGWRNLKNKYTDRWFFNLMKTKEWMNSNDDKNKININMHKRPTLQLISSLLIEPGSSGSHTGVERFYECWSKSGNCNKLPIFFGRVIHLGTFSRWTGFTCSWLLWLFRGFTFPLLIINDVIAYKGIVKQWNQNLMNP